MLDRTGVSRRTFLAAIGTAGGAALVGCSGEPETSGPDPAARTVEHPLGTAQVPVAPRRIVCTVDIATEDAAALDLPVIAGTAPNLTGQIPPYVRARLPADFVSMGRLSEVTVERIATLRPDLVIGHDVNLRENYDQMSRVAPTVAVPYEEIGQQDWAGRLRYIATATGAQDRVGAALDGYRARVAQIADRLPDPRPTVAVLRVFSDQIGYRTPGGSYPWSVLGDLGFRPAPGVGLGDRGTPQIQLPPEQVGTVDAEVIIVSVDGAVGPGTSGAGQLERLESNPLFARLSGRRVTVDSNEFVFGGLLTADRILDVVEANLTV